MPLGGRPVGLAVGDEAVWATNADDGTVSRIDPDSYEVVKTIGLGADVNAVATGFGSVWVAGGNDETLFRIDPGGTPGSGNPPLRRRRSAQAEARLLRRRRAQGPSGSHAGGSCSGSTRERTRSASVVSLPGNPIDLGAGGGNVWVTLEDERLVRVDEGSGNVRRRHRFPGLAYTPVVDRRMHCG